MQFTEKQPLGNWVQHSSFVFNTINVFSFGSGLLEAVKLYKLSFAY